MNLSLKIDTLKNISPQQFGEEYLKPQKPVLIKGLARETPVAKTWSVDYFKTSPGREKDTPVRIHYNMDLSNVLHTHFGGKKRVVLIAPEYKNHLYCLPLNTYSLVDIDKPDYKKYPALLSVKGYDLILDPGDTLFIPSGYWQYMVNPHGGFSISYRKMAGSLPAKLGGITNLWIRMPLDKLLNRILGPRWFEMKKEIARKRAYRAIEKEYSRTIPAFTGEKQDITFV